MPRKEPRRHGTKHVDPARTMCGRDASHVRVNDGAPDCEACLARIAQAIARGEGA